MNNIGIRMKRLIISFVVCSITVLSVYAQGLSEAEITATMYRAFELHKTHQYDDALDAFLLVGRNVDANRSEVERQVYVCSQTMACACHFSVKQYEKGYLLAKQLISSKLADSEKKDIYRYYTLNGYMLSSYLTIQGEYENADYKKARDILIEVAPYATDDLKECIISRIPLVWYKEAVMYMKEVMYVKAQMCFENALQGFQEAGQINNVISSLTHLGEIDYYTNRFDDAIAKYEQVLSLSIKTDDYVSQINAAKELHNLSNIVGDMNGVVKYANLIDSILANTMDPQAIFEYCDQMGNDAYDQGRYKLAELWYLKGKDIAENQAPSTVSANKFIAYSNLHTLYTADNRYDEALNYAYLALDESKKNSRGRDKDYYRAYIDIAYIYAGKGDRERCFESLDSLFEMEPYISEPQELSRLYTTRAVCSFDFMDYQSALADYEKADEILSSQYPASSPQRLNVYAYLGGVEHKLGYYDKSEHYYKLYSDGIRDIYGERSLKYIKSQIYLANAQAFAGRVDDGCNNYAAAAAMLKDVVKRQLPYMNSAEREGYWNSLCELYTCMTPYAIAAKHFQTKYTKSCYDAILLSKAFLLDFERSISDIVQLNGDDVDIQTYLNIGSMNKRVKELERNYAENANTILTLYNRIGQLERSLVNRCKSVGDMAAFMDVDYDVVKQNLKDNEVLVDFTDFVPKSGDRRYAAYIIKREQEYPLLKPMFFESQIDSLGIVSPDMLYDEDYVADVVKLIWNPIKEYIPEGATIYYVPSQMLFRVCFESLTLDDGTLLGDHYNFVRLSSARELVKRECSNRPMTNSAVLYGGLQYSVESNVMAESAKLYDLSSLKIMRGEDAVGGDYDFEDLPGAKIEVEGIRDILTRSNFNVTPYMGADGTEESFLNMHGKSPRILHVATHGFYYTPSDADEVDYLKGYSDAMLLSGLILSGGNAAWGGKELPSGTLGGVLTANNIARLDLSNTDLVVLSACQSGQGEATTEGLYGLQRAFKKAGVGTMVMTLWQVNDNETTEFMIAFYEALVETDWDKHKAFKIAKKKMRNKYPDDPNCWAVFVMLD